MKHNYLKLALLMVLCAVSLKGYAQTVDEVSLVTSAVGSTKDGATKNALMHAIELVYGTFVSANTDVLVDDAVKNEITASTNGSIKSHEEIFSIEMPNGKHLTTLRATVAIPKLTNYAQSKGFQTELAGATFGTALKERNMYAQNEVNVMNTLFEQLELLAPTIYDCNLVNVSEPTIKDGEAIVKATIKVLSNSNTKKFYDAMVGTLKALSLSEKMIEENKQCGFESYGYNIFLLSAPKDLRKYSLNLYVCKYHNVFTSNEQKYYFYNNFYPSYSGDSFANMFERVFSMALTSFIIKDNIGEVYSERVFLPSSKMCDKRVFDAYTGNYTNNVQVYIEQYNDYEGNCFGVSQGFYHNASYGYQLIFQCDNPNVVQYEIEYTITIPVDKITNINGFEITKKERQTDVVKTIPYDKVRVKPVFPLNESSFSDWIQQNMRYSTKFHLEETMKKDWYTSIQYTIDIDGAVTDVVATTTDGAYDVSHGEISKELARVISSSPKWSPGKDNDGEPVKVSYNHHFSVNLDQLRQKKGTTNSMQEDKPKSQGEDNKRIAAEDSSQKVNKPKFQGGGYDEFSKWVSQRLVYPKKAKKKGIEGNVILQFIIEPDGRLTNVKVARGVNKELDTEAVRVVSMSPKWTPARSNGKPARMRVSNFTVSFSLK